MTLDFVLEDIPEGFSRVPDVQEVYTNGKLIVLLGIPIDCEDEEESLRLHNCDHMGCGSLGPHVIGWAAVVSGCMAKKKEASGA